MDEQLKNNHGSLDAMQTADLGKEYHFNALQITDKVFGAVQVLNDVVKRYDDSWKILGMAR